MDTYLMKNEEKIKIEQAQAQYPQAQYPQPQYQHNQCLRQQYPQQRGGVNFIGRGQGGGFGRGRGQIICYNCGKPRNFLRDYVSFTNTCSYSKSFEHTVERCL